MEQLTRNFHQSEFMSRDGAPMPDSVLRNIRILAKNLQVLRDYIDAPIHINSGFRSPTHNRKVGGAPGSQHLLGTAADITVKNKTPKQVARAIMRLQKEGKMAPGGIGLYNGFVHYDIRGRNARWDFSSWYNFA